MALGKNLANNSQAKKVTLGRGKLYYARIDASTGKPTSDGWSVFGNISEASLTAESEFFEHFNSESGLRTRDVRIPLSTDATFNFTTTQMHLESRNLFLGGTSELQSHDNGIDTTVVAGDDLKVSDAIKFGRWYDLESVNGRRIYRTDKISTGPVFGVGGAAAASAAVTLTTDQYEIDHHLGRVRVRADEDGNPVDVNGNAIAGISEGDDFWLVSFTAPTGGDIIDPDEVRALQGSVELALKFVQEDTRDGESITSLASDGPTKRFLEFQMHSTTVAPNGDHNLITDEAQALPFTASINSNELADPDSKFITVRNPYLTSEG